MKSSENTNKWYLDSGCSKHMTGDKGKFTLLTLKKGGRVIFGDNSKGNIIGVGTICMAQNLFIKHVLLVDGLKHNLLSISQLCDKNYEVIFDGSKCSINSIADSKTLIVGQRHENVYMLDLCHVKDVNIKCLTAINDNSWLWHRRVGHANLELISKLSKKDLVVGLPKIDLAKKKNLWRLSNGETKENLFLL